MNDSLRGQFLIAGCGLKDPNFFKTAVLIVEHGPDGAMGLVVNRPSSVTVSHVLTGHLDLPKTKDLVYCGGPVEPAALFVIHDCGHIDPDESPVVPGVYMGSSAEVFESIVCPDKHKPQCRKYRVYCGCAGWGSGQLESELERGDWRVLPAEASFVFHPNPYSVWDELIAASLRSHRLIGQKCQHPEWN